MNTTCHIQITKDRWGKPQVSTVTQGKPRVQRGSLLMRLVIELPDNAFDEMIPEAVVRLEPGVNFATVVAHAEMPEGVEDEQA